MNQPSNPHLTVDIGTLFSVGESHNRLDPTNWLNNGQGSYEPLCTLTQPVEAVGVTGGPAATTSREGPSVSITFAPTDGVSVRGFLPDSYVCDTSQPHGHMMTSVDTLSRSIQLLDLEPSTVLDWIETQSNRTAVIRAARCAISRWRFDELDEPMAAKARMLLRENVRRHERTHVTYSLNPQTALWKELELQYRWMLLSAVPTIWSDQDFLGRFLSRLGTPSTYLTELLAILNEEYTTEIPAVRHTVETRVAAHQDSAINALVE